MFRKGNYDTFEVHLFALTFQTLTGITSPETVTRKTAVSCLSGRGLEEGAMQKFEKSEDLRPKRKKIIKEVAA